VTRKTNGKGGALLDGRLHRAFPCEWLGVVSPRGIACLGTACARDLRRAASDHALGLRDRATRRGIRSIICSIVKRERERCSLLGFSALYPFHPPTGPALVTAAGEPENTGRIERSSTTAYDYLADLNREQRRTVRTAAIVALCTSRLTFVKYRKCSIKNFQ
jgi:hypothetical protein